MANEDVTNRDLFVVLQRDDSFPRLITPRWRPLVVIDLGPFQPGRLGRQLDSRRSDMTPERLLAAYAKDYAIDLSTLSYVWCPRIELPPSAYFPHDWADVPAEPPLYDALRVCRHCKRIESLAPSSCPGLRAVDEGDMDPERYRRLVAPRSSGET